MGSVCGTYWRREKSVQGFGGNPEGKRPLVRTRRRWEEGIRMVSGESESGRVVWIQLAQDRGRCRAFLNAVMKFRFLVQRS
jgi:hypothetical protein